MCSIIIVLYRSTAFGVHSGIGRIGAILGNVMFGHLLDVNQAIPILTVASLLLVGGLSAVFLPPVYRPENRPPLVKLLHNLNNKCRSKIFNTRATTYGLDAAADHDITVASTSM